MSLSREEARRIAEEALPMLFPGLGEPVRIDDAGTRLVRDHWVFFWNTVEYLDIGTEDARLAGNAPIVVRASDGKAFKADIHRSLEEQLVARDE